MNIWCINNNNRGNKQNRYWKMIYFIVTILYCFVNISLINGQLCAFEFDQSLRQVNGSLECAIQLVQIGSNGSQAIVTPQFNSLISDQFTEAFKLYGQHQPINTVNSLQFLANHNASITYAFWIYIDSLQHSRNAQTIQSIVDFSNPSQNHLYYGLTQQDNNGRFSYFCAGIDSVLNIYNRMQECTLQPIPTREWIHIALVIDQSPLSISVTNNAQISILINGVLSKTFEGNGKIEYTSLQNNNMPAFQLGSLGGVETTAFTGYLRQFVYAQYAMSVEQIQRLAIQKQPINNTTNTEIEYIPIVDIALPESTCSYIQPYSKEIINKGVGFKQIGCGLQIQGKLNASYTKSIWLHWDRLDVASIQPFYSGPISLISNVNRNTMQVSPWR